MSEEALQIAEKRREATGTGEKEKFTHLNAEFQRIARRDKKAFLSKQCQETDENNGMGKTRDLFKKIRYQENTVVIANTLFQKAQEKTLHMDITRWSTSKLD